MILVNRNNFSLKTMHKDSDSDSHPKNTFYADLRICFVLNGFALWEIEEETYPVEKNDVIFLNIGQKRRLCSFGKEGFDLCILNLNRNAFSNIHHFMFFRECVKRGKCVDKNNTFIDLLKEIQEEWVTDSPFRYELASAKLTEFFIKSERRANYVFTPVTRREKEILEQMNEIDANITKGVGLREVSRKAGMTESTFSRHFLSLNGISFQQYVLAKKLQYALQLMKKGEMKMIDIAFESGFNSISGFYDAFRKRFGTTPGQLSSSDF